MGCQGNEWTSLKLRWLNDGWPNGEKLACKFDQIAWVQVVASQRKVTPCGPDHKEVQVDARFLIASACESVWPGRVSNGSAMPGKCIKCSVSLQKYGTIGGDFWFVFEENWSSVREAIVTLFSKCFHPQENEKPEFSYSYWYSGLKSVFVKSGQTVVMKLRF